MAKYNEYKKLDFPAFEQGVLAFWRSEQIFKKSVESRPADKPFIFYEGPPSANGMPGIHHVMARAVKDTFCRYKSLQGYRVDRKGGWDTHGLPVELQVEKELGIIKEDIGKKISIAEYNQKCRETVMRYKKVWEDLTERIGFWVDMDNPYITYENDYIESLWHLLKMLYDKGLLYKGYTIQPYSPAAGTGLSSHELNQPGTYKPVKDVTAVAMFKINGGLSSLSFGEGWGEATGQKWGEPYFLAWTTTPWTLPSNTALAVGKDIDYVVVNTFNAYSHEPITVVLAKALVGKHFNEKARELKLDEYKPGDKLIPYEVVAELKGSDLVGLQYEQLLPYALPESERKFEVLAGDFVTTEDGTGIVHIAPSFGADDFRVAKQNNVGALTLVDKRGKFTDEVTDFAGEYVKEAYLTEAEKAAEIERLKNLPQNNELNKLISQIVNRSGEYLSVDDRIVLKLQLEGKLFKKEKYEHTYPHCWRTDKPILYYPLDSWFIKTTALKDRMVELNKTINWKPKSTGEGRFGNWLENLQDWNLSRSRYWGTPLPIWRTEDGLEEKCIGSVEELKAEMEKSKIQNLKSKIEVLDLHRPYVDEIILVSDSGKPMKRELDLIDVWFDSGAMPYAQHHWGPLTPEGGKTHQPQGGEENEQSHNWKTAHPALYQLLKENAKGHKQNPTMAEQVLWDALSGKKLLGAKFRQQHIIGDVIPDFVCLSKKVVIEVDGEYHNTPEQKEADVSRTKYLNHLGYSVIRFSNPEILNGLDVVLKRIEKELAHRPTLPKLGYNSPPFGRGGFPPPSGAGGLFPADYIAEGVDQTRGWFFTLHALSTMLFDSVAYKNVVSNGLVLDKAGNKMSKSKGNVVDPFKLIEKYGVDALRWYMLANADPWDNLKFDEEGVAEVQRKFFGTLYNTYSFFSLYANVDGFVVDENNTEPTENLPEMDRWILSKLNSLVQDVTTHMNDYEPTKAARLVEEFVDRNLSNWYVRLCRRRFWKGEMGADKNAAYETLHQCLKVLAQLVSPMAPFFGEWLYKNLVTTTDSVHLSNWPEAATSLIDPQLEERMEQAQDTCSLVLSLRKKTNLKVRQPLQKVMIPVLNDDMKNALAAVADIIKSEVNVKEVELVTDEAIQLIKKIKPNFKTLGVKLGQKMKLAATVVAAFSQEDIKQIEQSGFANLNLEGDSFRLELADVEITSEDIPGWQVATSGKLTVALDTTLTENLKNEGLARELVNRLQNQRKDSGFDVTDRIVVHITRLPELQPALADYADYICGEILADSIQQADEISGGTLIELEDLKLITRIERSAN